MLSPGADTVRYGCREEKDVTFRPLSTAPTEITPRQTPGSSTGESSSPELPDAATTRTPLRTACNTACWTSSGHGSGPSVRWLGIPPTLMLMILAPWLTA